MKLRPLALADEEPATAAHRELASEGFDFLFDRDRAQTWANYLNYVDAIRLGIDLPADRVPATFLIAEVREQLVGRVSLRHELTPSLAAFGGHIGYAVRPQFRRRGYATEMLRGALDLAADIGLTRVLITCNEDNVGSIAVIERCGGVLEDTAPHGTEGQAKRRYWAPPTRDQIQDSTPTR